MPASWRPAGVDLVLALGLTVVAQLEIWATRLVPGITEVTGSRPLLSATSFLVTLPLAWRRQVPLVVLVLVLGTLDVQTVLTTPTEGLSTLVAALLAAYSGSAYASPARAAAAGVAVVIGSALMGDDVSDKVFIVILLGAVWLLGFVIGQGSEALRRAEEDNRELAQRLADAADKLAEAEVRVAAGPRPDELATLTAREVEVVRAIAAGMSNAEIATNLFISEWTVKTHVASVLRKLALRDRAQVVVAAYESGLIVPRVSEPPPGAH